MVLFLIIVVGYCVSHTYPGPGISATEAQGLTHARRHLLLFLFYPLSFVLFLKLLENQGLAKS